MAGSCSARSNRRACAASILWGLWTHPSRRHQLGPARQRLRARRRPDRLPLPDAALRRQRSSSRSTTTRTTSGFGTYVQVAGAAAGGLARRSGPATRRPAQSAAALRPARQRPAAHCAACRSARTASKSLTPFARTGDGPADPSDPRQERDSPRVGKVTHPSAAPGQSPADRLVARPGQRQYTVHVPAIDGGIYLIKERQADRRAGPDAAHQERSEVQRAMAAGPGALQAHLRRRRADAARRRWPTTASCRRTCRRARRSAWSAPPACTSAKAIPTAWCRPASVTATFAGGNDPRLQRPRPVQHHEHGASLNWFDQGADAGLYDNSDIHAIRILAMEPTTDRHARPKSRPAVPQPRQRAAAHPRRNPGAQVSPGADGKQPLDPDGNPDTSFLAKIPADVAFTFQTLDKNGMVLNMAQTWHQLRPGEIRNDCGGCHAHSQKPTALRGHRGRQARLPGLRPDQADAAADRPRRTTNPARSGTRKDETGLRFDKGVKNVEYLPRRQADPRPQLRRLPHAEGGASRPATWCWTTTQIGADLPATSRRRARHLLPPGAGLRRRSSATSRSLSGRGGIRNASRYVRMFQSRRSLLIWKIFGQRTRRLEQRRLPDRDDARRSEDAALQGQAGRRHAAEPQPRRPRLTPAASCRRRKPSRAPTSGRTARRSRSRR